MGILGILFGQTKAVIGVKEDSGLGGALGKIKGVLRETIGGVAGIVVDASISEDHLTSCDVTDNPVEDGAKITDHVQIKPAELSMDGVITDNPLGYAIIGNIQNVKRTVEGLFGKSSRSIDQYNELTKLQSSRQPFTVVTGLKRYKNMIMEELSVTRTAQSGKSIHFRAKMKEIRIVKSSVAGVGKLGSVAKKIASKTKDLGQKVTDAVEKGNKLNNASSAVSSKTQGSILDGWLNH
jgi:hypothetical protein